MVITEEKRDELIAAAREWGSEDMMAGYIGTKDGKQIAALCRIALAALTDEPIGPQGNTSLVITLPDIGSKAFWHGSGKSEVFLPSTYYRWVKEAIERHCAMARIEVEVK